MSAYSYNTKIFERNVPSSNLQMYFDPRPVNTSIPTNVYRQENKATPVIVYPEYNPQNTFNPGTETGPWSGFADNINIESELRSQTYALQKGGTQSYYIPSSNSDLYVETIDQYKNPPPMEHPLLFLSEPLPAFNPTPLNYSSSQIFFTDTRNQIKNIKS